MNYFKSIIIRPTKSKYTLLRKISRYELIADVKYKTNVVGIKDIIIIPKGYIFDGRSIPRICWTIIGNPWDTDVLGASLVHDYLYEIDVKRGKYYADLVFLEALLAAGCSPLKAKICYLAVKLFGRGEFNKTQPTQIG